MAASRPTEYGPRHLMAAHGDERGNRYEDRYDSHGRVIAATLPDGTVRQVTDDIPPGGITLNDTDNPRSRITTVTDNLGQQRRYTYDAHQNLIRSETRNADRATDHPHL